MVAGLDDAQRFLSVQHCKLCTGTAWGLELDRPGFVEVVVSCGISPDGHLRCPVLEQGPKQALPAYADEFQEVEDLSWAGIQVIAPSLHSERCEPLS
jgi:hypothetical protein